MDCHSLLLISFTSPKLTSVMQQVVLGTTIVVSVTVAVHRLTHMQYLTWCSVVITI